MRVPTYRKHSSGQARVTINCKDYLLGPYGSQESKEAYGRLIAQYGAANKPKHFGTPASKLTMGDVRKAFLDHSKKYYSQSDEHYHYQHACKPIAELYASVLVSDFGPIDYKAVREWCLQDESRSRQYVNKQMSRLRHVVKWAVAEGMMAAESLTALKCVEPLKRGRNNAREAQKIKPVSEALVEATLRHTARVVGDMIRFQLLTGCRPGEVCAITPSMVNRAGDIWSIDLDKHKTAWRDKQRVIFVGPMAQAVLRHYLLRAGDAHRFSPAESERQRLEAKHEARVTPISCGNKPGTNKVRRPSVKAGTSYDSRSYFNAIKYACKKGQLEQWAPNRLRHSKATEIRAKYGLDAASAVLGHSNVDVTQVYAEQDREKAMQIAKEIG